MTLIPLDACPSFWFSKKVLKKNKNVRFVVILYQVKIDIEK